MKVRGMLGAALALFIAATPTITAAGLLYPDGIEPGDSSVGEAPTGNRNWYVDSAAPDGGDGSYLHPYNSFEKVVGWSSPDTSYHPGLLRGGDVLYVKGTFLGSKNAEGTHNTVILLARAAQGGTADKPTIIKSWRGKPRAVFEGEFARQDMIRVYGSEAAFFGAIKIQNLEVTHAKSRGINISECVSNAELVGLYRRR